MKPEAPLLVADRIVALMHQRRISEAALAREIGVPQATINRILSGATRDPRISTLIGIARVLGTTVDHLVCSDSPHAVPLLEWDQLLTFLDAGIDELRQSEWVLVYNKPEKGSFALRTTPSMEPRYRNASTIIVEPVSTYRDYQVAIVSFSGGDPTARQLVKDGSNIALRPLTTSSGGMTEALSEDVKIIGIVTEARITE